MVFRTAITVFSSLSQMKVKNLILSQAGLTSVADISAANSVQILDISLNAITDISPLSNMTNVKILNVSNNPIINFAVLQLCSTLESITCAGVPVTSSDELIFANAGISLIK